MNDQTMTILMAIITTLGGGAAWKFYAKRFAERARIKKEELKSGAVEENMYIMDLKQRIERLEKLLEQASEEKDEMRKEIVKLTAETSALKAEIEYIRKENDLLKEVRSRFPVNRRKKK